MGRFLPMGRFLGSVPLPKTETEPVVYGFNFQDPNPMGSLWFRFYGFGFLGFSRFLGFLVRVCSALMFIVLLCSLFCCLYRVIAVIGVYIQTNVYIELLLSLETSSILLLFDVHYFSFLHKSMLVVVYIKSLTQSAILLMFILRV